MLGRGLSREQLLRPPLLEEVLRRGRKAAAQQALGQRRGAFPGRRFRSASEEGAGAPARRRRVLERGDQGPKHGLVVCWILQDGAELWREGFQNLGELSLGRTSLRASRYCMEDR